MEKKTKKTKKVSKVKKKDNKSIDELKEKIKQQKIALNKIIKSYSKPE